MSADVNDIPWIQLALILVVGAAVIRVAPQLLKIAVRTAILLAVAVVAFLWWVTGYFLG
jgi:hypothetical protein